MRDWMPNIDDIVQGVNPASAPGWRGEVVGIYRVSPENNRLHWVDVRWETSPGEDDRELTRVPLDELEPFVWPGEELAA